MIKKQNKNKNNKAKIDLFTTRLARLLMEQAGLINDKEQNNKL